MEGPKLKRNMEGRNWNKTNTNPKEKKELHTRDTQDKVSAGAESSLHSEKNKPNGSSDFVVAALFTFVMYGLMLREIKF